MLLEGHAGSIGELVSEVKRIAKQFKRDDALPEEIWYRGQSACSWGLLPPLYRAEQLKYHYNEASLVNRFVALATPLVNRIPSSDWEWYFLARHHGLPSRLLDWSESLMTALYFALYGHVAKDRLELDERLRIEAAPACFDDHCPTIWLLDAGTINISAFGDDVILVPGGDRSRPYLPDE